ncbi:hypothetical protein DIURU_004777 [Diutina rugosa]|uniref:RFX-type winged-helix domain-containing protein n=1 Tax=Diutina rugosa TaxID=5481 RepID=A0A642UF76_DIURU|nr:uncharacterized protein DIURU_004777 [Diutina rugosa]KAA8897924.1 hypothetical protein DIURU_004777 [Diutina rugosa]
MEGHGIDDYDKGPPPPQPHPRPPGAAKPESGDWSAAAGNFRTPQRYSIPSVPMTTFGHGSPQQPYPPPPPQFELTPMYQAPMVQQQFSSPLHYRFPPHPAMVPAAPVGPQPPTMAQQTPHHQGPTQALHPGAHSGQYESLMPPPNISSPEMSSSKSRKRTRKDSVSLLDDGDNELKQMAYAAAAETNLQELAARIKSMDTEDLRSYGTQTGVTGSPGTAQHDLAVHGRETKERQRQVFGMVWLINSCDASPTAVVPRNRIYARYAMVCADNNLSPLSPASFGKLVRILFPNLTTRRLGMRGHSKYHYCGIRLNSDSNVASSSAGRGHHRSTSSFGSISSLAAIAASPGSSAQSSPRSPDDGDHTYQHTSSPKHFITVNSPQVERSTVLEHQVPSVAHLAYIPDLFSAVEQLNSIPGGIELPPIYPYVPPGTDADIADTLYSLYKVHINALFESLRYMQLKPFFASFSNFNSILTAPVIKLYTSEPIVRWIQQCDLLLYKRMICMLTRLQLSANLHPEVVVMLKQVADGFVKAMTTNLVNHKTGRSLLQCKLVLAKSFTNLLVRLIKVIETGQAAMRILRDEDDKRNMLSDWMQLDLDQIIYRELGCSDANLAVVQKVLKQDVVELLSSSETPKQVMTSIVNYLADLPGKFTNVNPRLFIILASNLLMTCLREISISSSKGIGAWWVMRVWVDERILWSYELGGFLEDDIARLQPTRVSQSSPQAAANPRPPPAPAQSQTSPSASAPSSAPPPRGNLESLNRGGEMSGGGDGGPANSSFGTIDLMDFSLGWDATSEPPESSSHKRGDPATAPAPPDMLLNYETNEIFLG